MSGFTPISALVGGGLIGLAVALFLASSGRATGISGILGGLVPPSVGSTAWRVLFLVGLVAGVGIYRLAGGPLTDIQITPSQGLLVAGGLLVGVGTQVGAGCTSGHGVCGIGRVSPRSIVATIVFMVTAGITVFIVRHMIGGAG